MHFKNLHLPLKFWNHKKKGKRNVVKEMKETKKKQF